VRLWRDYVYGVNVPHRRPAVLEAVDVRDVGIEDVIFLDDIVDELLAVLVDNEYLPLLVGLASGGRAGVRDMHTSPRVVDFMVLRMTVARQLATLCEKSCARTAYALAECLSCSRPNWPCWRGAAAGAAEGGWKVEFVDWSRVCLQ
jgi:hypothetical protein